MTPLPNQARIVFRNLRPTLIDAADHTEAGYPVNATTTYDHILTDPVETTLPGQHWNGSADSVELSILPNSVIDHDPMTRDSILFQIKGDDKTYEVSEFREEKRGYLGNLTYELKDLSKSGKSA